ncbi:MAG: hypothetical protein WD751_03170 [Anaerolineales bacterium]
MSDGLKTQYGKIVFWLWIWSIAIVLTSCGWEETSTANHLDIPIPLSIFETILYNQIDKQLPGEIYWSEDDPVAIELDNWEAAKGSGYTYIVLVDLDLKARVDYAKNPDVDIKIYIEPRCIDGQISFRVVDRKAEVNTSGILGVVNPVSWFVDWVGDEMATSEIDKIITDRFYEYTEVDENAKCIDLWFDDPRTMTVRFLDYTVTVGGDGVDLEGSGPYFDDEPIEPEQSIEFTNISVLFDVEVDGDWGMIIDNYYTTHNLRNYECKVASYFEFSNGEILRDFNDSYTSTDGQVSVGDSAYPEYAHTDIMTPLFIPYAEMHLAEGTYDLRFVTQINCESQVIQSSDYVYITVVER